MHSKKKIDYSHLCALVTGASSGIGLEYARLLAQIGCSLVVVSNQCDELMSLAANLAAEYKVRVTPIHIDLAREQAAQELYDACKRQNCQIDILINNAGVFSFGDLVQLQSSVVTRLISLHIVTLSELCRLFGRDMVARKNGYILNMSSLSAWLPVPGIALYNASKSYIRNFSHSLHQELLPHGVSVTVVCPGGVATNLYNLSGRLQLLGVRLGILMTPQALARRALRAMFGKRRQIVPGLINKLFIPIFSLIPSYLILYAKRRIEQTGH